LIFGSLTVQENLELGAYTLDDEEEMKKNLEYVYHLYPRLAERRLLPNGSLKSLLNCLTKAMSFKPDEPLTREQEKNSFNTEVIKKAFWGL